MIITKTPLRISLFGGGSDFPQHYEKHGGAVLSIAIDKYIYTCINGRHDGKTAVNHGPNHDIADTPTGLKHELIREANKTLFYNYDIDMSGTETTTIADVSGKGSGLGSSSALLVGYIAAATYNTSFSKTERGIIVDMANYIEIDKLKRPQGIQDAYPPFYGGMGLYRFDMTNGRLDATKESIPEDKTKKLFKNLLMFSTGQTRQSKEVLKEQHAKTAVNHAKIKQLAQMAHEAKDAILSDDYEYVGHLLNDSWQIKRSLSSSISNDIIDNMYTIARAEGAIGGKVCGAGGGGYMLLYVPVERQTAVRRRLSAFRELPIEPVEKGIEVIYNGN